MLVAIGIAVVLVGVFGGYMMEHGNLSVLIQPAEIVIIFGAAIGSLLIASPPKVVKLIVKDIGKIFGSSAIGRETYIELLMLLNQLFWKIRREGLLAIEGDVENPNTSEIFNRFKSVISNHHTLNFICDNFRVIITTNMLPHELDSLLEIDIEANHYETLIPANSITKVSDALPGLGIVAAVLGVVITMGKISEPPEVLGHSIGAALVGTFLGVLACYGFVGPMATNLEHKAKDHETYFNVVRTAMVAFVGGAAPQIAVESGRRAIAGEERPSFTELEEEIKKWKDKT
jgi:chemotaxis protein MotA